jgi:hypothetical protein
LLDQIGKRQLAHLGPMLVVSAIGLRRGYALSQVARLGRDRVIGREHRFGDVVATLCLPDLRHLQNRGLDFRSW